MKQAACPKLWQVEALRDHKLTGQLRVEALAHLASCAICEAENQALTALQVRLKVRMPVNEIALRRLRGRLLAKADGQVHGQARHWRYGWLALAGFTAVLASALLVSWYLRKPSTQVQVQLQASTGAVWTRTSVSGIEYIDLADGLLNLAVNRRPSEPRLIVRVPDGEVEDTGTRFRIWVSGGRTREIAVETGSVVYRQRDGNSVVLRSGAVWRSGETPAASASATPGAVPSATHSGEAASANALPPSLGGPTTSRKPLQPPLPTAAPAGATDEDLAYLHIVALLHEARDEEARLAARDYLRRYPDGFRRIEVSKLLEPSATGP